MPSYFEEDIQLWHRKLILLDAVAAKLDCDASHSFEIENEESGSEKCVVAQFGGGHGY